jgi:hypothetical protein
MEDTGEINWNEQLEEILSKEGERALCYSWLHLKSQGRFAKLDTNIALPVIVLSTLAGTGSIASQSLFGGSQAANIVIGAISLTVGVMNTVSNYFGFAKRSEAHRIAGTTYAKIHKFILIELSLPRRERMKAKDALKIIRDQLERLNEISPQIPDQIIADFNDKFHDQKDVSKPEITNGLDPILVYVEHSDRMSPRSSVNVKLVPEKPPTPPPATPKPPPPPVSAPKSQQTQVVKVATPTVSPTPRPT